MIMVTVMENIIRKGVDVDEMQYGFLTGMVTIDAVFIGKRL